MSKVDDYTAVLRQFFYVEHRNEAFRLPEVLDGTGLRSNRTFEAAKRRLREQMTDEGVCFRIACPANDYTYAVVDDPAMVLDAKLHLYRLADGVKRTQRNHHDQFLRDQSRRMSRDDREINDLIEKYEKQRDATDSLINEFVAQNIRMRRDRRREQGD